MINIKQLSSLLKRNQASISNNIISNWLGLIVGIGTSFVMMPFLIRHLGKAGYGLWVLIMSTMAYISMLDVGIYASIRRYIAMFDGKTDTENINKCLSSSMFIYLLIGLISLLVGIIISFTAPIIFHVEKEVSLTFSLTFSVVAVGVAVRFPLGVAHGALNAFQRYDISNYLGIFGEILKALLIIVLVKLGMGIVVLGIMYSLELTCRSLAEWYYLRKLKPYIKISRFLVTREHLGLIKNYSVVSFAIVIAEAIYSNMDVILIGMLYSPSVLTLYVIAKTIVVKAAGIMGGITRVFTPAISKLDGTGALFEIKHLWVNALRLCIVIGALLGIGIFTMGGKFINLWLGGDFETSTRCLMILSIGLLFNFAQGVSNPLFYGISKHHYIAKLTFLNIGLSLCLIFLLNRPLGIVGIAYAMTIGNCITSIAAIVAACKILDISAKEYILKSAKLALVGVLLLIFSKGVLSILEIKSYGTFVFMVLIQVSFYSLFCYSFGFDKNDRQYLRNKLRPIWKPASSLNS